jgi:hypothetical protein
MKLQSTTLSSVATSAPIPLDRSANPFSVGLVLEVTGTNTSTVQLTLDDIFNPNVTPVWFNHSTLAAIITTTSGNIAFNCTAVRLNMTAFTIGSATLQVLQGKQG